MSSLTFKQVHNHVALWHLSHSNKVESASCVFLNPTFVLSEVDTRFEAPIFRCLTPLWGVRWFLTYVGSYKHLTVSINYFLQNFLIEWMSSGWYLLSDSSLFNYWTEVVISFEDKVIKWINS